MQQISKNREHYYLQVHVIIYIFWARVKLFKKIPEIMDIVVYGFWANLNVQSNFHELSTVSVSGKEPTYSNNISAFQITYIVELGPHCSVTSNPTNNECEREECGLVRGLEEERKKNEIKRGLKGFNKLRFQREKREKGDEKKLL